MGVGNRVGEVYEDLSTVVLSIPQAETGTAPAAEESEKASCSSTAFPKLFTFRERSRNAGFSCYNVIPLPENCAQPPCLPLGIKDSLKENARLLDMGTFLMGGFWLKGNCRRENC
jgi:hypothetical protein